MGQLHHCNNWTMVMFETRLSGTSNPLIGLNTNVALKKGTHITQPFFCNLSWFEIFICWILILNKLFHKVIIIVIISSISKWCSKWYGCFQDDKGPRNINLGCQYFFARWIFYSTYICFVKSFIVHIIISLWNKMSMCIGWLI